MSELVEWLKGLAQREDESDAEHVARIRTALEYPELDEDV